MLIIIPENPKFQETLDNIPFFFGKLQSESTEMLNLVVDAETRLMRSASEQEFTEYLWGGEYDQLLSDYEEEEELTNLWNGCQEDSFIQTLVAGF
ncbi:hypothetical protein NO976_02560 [Planktothrix agardhii]|jgi:hypothetical protein|uniref:hypothetical protein n=1 Tax=Planktothrix agardhii TaxID=1160 RepID=UPI001A184972|nr:hypothetical protein [Planktothrix agardhii]MBG0746639.1 hypothetical protein [Planktothrix agardhii KL2]MCF3575193.1 hypothetical protein [Planktothrix agardhii 1812]MCF3581018.1 hypothetical protein [Planktothrix agardhii 1811]MCF3625620.1 hypothetical protein [Planktothrix agardhii 1801]CAD5950077.1 hypothetical protein NO976_02560 [Planktothrix agardhii]